MTFSPFFVHKAMEAKGQPTAGPHFVGKKDELIEAKRSFRTFEGRDILIICHQGVFYAMDSYCYREYTSSSAEHKHAAIGDCCYVVFETCQPSLDQFKKKLLLI